MKGRLISVLSQLRRVVVRQSEGGLSDGQLLERFVGQRDEAAFEVLVWRHGPMVLGVGRRLLHNLQDAEDILQATFLSLVRQARTIRRSEAVAHWLYKVAYRLSLRLRQQRQKRAFDPVAIDEIAAPQPPGRDDLSLLDEELQHLPDKYRIPLVLSYLQGMTNQEIADHLLCPVGTVFTRLARGRELLRKRLARRGVTLAAVLASVALTAGSTTAALRVELVRSLIPVALAFAGGSGPAAGVLSPNVVVLMEGVQKMLRVSRWRHVVGMLTLLAVLGSGAGLLARRGASHEEQNPATKTEKAEQPAETPAKAAAKDAQPQERDRPKIVQVFPADGATNVEPDTEIRIRFDRAMDANRAVLYWDFRGKGGFRPRGELRYAEATHEFVLPVQLAPGCKHDVTANRQTFDTAKDFDGFQSKEHVAAKPYHWSFTTKTPSSKEGSRPRVTSLNPPADTEVSQLTALEVTFDQPMDSQAYSLSYDMTFGTDRVPELLGTADYDEERHRFTLLVSLPANWNGELRLEGFRTRKGVQAEPFVVKYRTQRAVHSDALRKRMEQAAKAEKLQQLVERVRKARRDLRSVTEEARWTTCYGQHPYWYLSFEIKSSRFLMQGKQQYVGIIDAIMGMPFRVGSDGTTCWLRRGNDQIALPARQIKEQDLHFCDAFDALGMTGVERILTDMKLDYLGESKIRGRNCHRVRSWVVSLTAFGLVSPVREWYIDTETLLPLRVEMAGMGLHSIDYTHSRINQPIPDKEFSPDGASGVKSVDADRLTEGYTHRFLTVNDGSGGRMSVRWGMKGPKGQSSSGLN